MVKAYRIRTKTISYDSKNDKNGDVICLRHTSSKPKTPKRKAKIVFSLKLDDEDTAFLRNLPKKSDGGD